MKHFLIFHTIFCILFSIVIILGASVLSGFTISFIAEIPMFILGSLFYNLKYTIPIGTIFYFIKTKFSIKIGKNG